MEKHLIGIILLLIMVVTADFPPSDGNATTEARKLLAYLYKINGKHIMAGQVERDHHNGGGSETMLRVDWDIVGNITGTYPSVYGNQFLWGSNAFADPYRQAMIERVITLYKPSSGTSSHVVPQINFHLCPPMTKFKDYNCTWDDICQGRPSSLIDNILDEGTVENKIWIQMVDHMAGFLLQLQSAHVPVLWRPFHESNGGWFWWGKQPRFTELWKQMYQRLTIQHNLHNLLWIYGASSQFSIKSGELGGYPGDEYVDILGVDAYVDDLSGFTDANYQELAEVGSGRPIALTEVGFAPTATFLKEKQPNYVYWLMWGTFESSHNTPEALNDLYNDAWTLTQGEVSF